jgi:Recombination endonuclease VII
VTTPRRADPICKDCKVEFAQAPKIPKRPAPEPGPRCATHWRVEVARARAAAHERRVQTIYGIEEGDYWQLYAFQGGVCAICVRAKGKTKRLAVDHDHKTGEVRGLLCGPCNQLLGHGRDDPEFFARIIHYLNYPPFGVMKRGES